MQNATKINNNNRLNMYFTKLIDSFRYIIEKYCENFE